jgi:hypothetical protein
MATTQNGNRRASRKAHLVRGKNGRTQGLPRFLRPLFWEYDFHVLNWKRDWYLVTGRVLSRGDWRDVCWLRRRLGDEGLRSWLRASEGRGLSRKQIRYWELILDLPKHEVDAWLARPGRVIWDNRVKR